MARKVTIFQNHRQRVAIHTYGELAGVALTAHTHMLPASVRRCDSLEEGDDGFCEDVIPITGDHVSGIGHVHILGVRALLEETLGPCLT